MAFQTPLVIQVREKGAYPYKWLNATLQAFGQTMTASGNLGATIRWATPGDRERPAREPLTISCEGYASQKYYIDLNVGAIYASPTSSQSLAQLVELDKIQIKSQLNGRVRICKYDSNVVAANYPPIANARVYISYPVLVEPKGGPYVTDSDGYVSFPVAVSNVDASQDKTEIDVYAEADTYKASSLRYTRQQLTKFPGNMPPQLDLTPEAGEQPIRKGYFRIEAQQNVKGKPQVFVFLQGATVQVMSADSKDKYSQADSNSEGLAEYYLPEPVDVSTEFRVVVSKDGYATYDALRKFSELMPAKAAKVPVFEVVLISNDNLIAVDVTVKDSVSKAPIKDASIYVDGQAVSLGGGSAVRTDAQGSARFSIPAGSQKLGAARPGEEPQYTNELRLNTWTHYDVWLGEGEVGGGVRLRFEFDSTPGDVQNKATGAQVSATATLNGKTISGEATVGGNGRAELVPLFPTSNSMTYKVMHSAQYQVENISIDVQKTLTEDGCDWCVIPVSLKLAGADSAGQEQSPVDVGPGTAFDSPLTSEDTSAVDTVDEDTEEFIYPNSSDGKYFTATQARFYVGDVFVDELYQCQFALQQNRIPIYGYASRDYDAVGTGKALVQGQLAINFVSEGYMYTLLNEFHRLMKSQDATQQDVSEMTNLTSRIAALNSQLRSGMPDSSFDDSTLRNMPKGARTLDNDLPNPDGAMAQNFLAQQEQRKRELEELQAKVNDLAARNPAVVGEARRKRQMKFNGYHTPDVNATYLDVPFTIEVQLEGAGRVITRRLEGCLLGANEQIYDHSGCVLLDCYSFIARRLR